jgi:hypothetical protein
MRLKPHITFRFERDGDRQGLCLVAPAEHSPHWSAHEDRWRVEDVLERADVLAAAARSRIARRSLARPSVLISRSLGGARRCGRRCSRTAVERESRCVPLPRVASGRLGVFQTGCDPSQPYSARVLLAVP